jgi:cytochrome c-type biogenesis protein CcmH/NrfG
MKKLLSFLIRTNIYLLVFLTPLFFLPFSFEAFEFNKQYLLFFLVSSAVFAWLAKMVVFDKEVRFKRTPLDIPILAFVLIGIIGTLFSADKASSIFGFYGKFSDGLVSLISLVAMYFLITNNVLSEKSKDKDSATVPGITKAFFWSLFFVLLVSALSVFGVLGKIKSLPFAVQSVSFSPVAGSLEGLAMFLAVALIFLTGLMMVKDQNSSKFRDSMMRLFWLASLLMLILIDFGRAWILVFLSSLICLAITLWKRMFKDDVNKLLLPIVLVIVSVAFLIVNSSIIQATILKNFLPQEQVLNQKYSLIIGFKSATASFKNGLVGSGPGTFFHDFVLYKPQDFNNTSLWQIRFDRAGDYFAEILATMGFLGLAFYIFLISLYLMIGYLFLLQKREALPMIMATLALVIGQIVYYQSTVLALFFWLFLALSAIAWQKPIKEKSIAFKSFPELSLIFSVIVIVLGLGLAALYFFAARFYIADADYLKSVNQGDNQLLEKSISFNPYQPIYKMVLSRRYLSEMLKEASKPSKEVDKDLVQFYAFQAVGLAKGGEVGNVKIVGATEISPNHVSSWETLAVIYREIQGIFNGATEWAIKSFERAISLEPNSPILYTELGKVYLNNGEIEKAREQFQKAQELKPDYADAFIQEALMYEKQGKINEAIKQMEAVAQQNPNNPEILFQLGRLYFNNNQVTNAIAQFEAVISLAPNHSNAHYSLGAAYQFKGDKQKAIAEFEKVLELNPGNQDIQNRINQLKAPKEEGAKK